MADYGKKRLWQINNNYQRMRINFALLHSCFLKMYFSLRGIKTTFGKCAVDYMKICRMNFFIMVLLPAILP